MTFDVKVIGKTTMDADTYSDISLHASPTTCITKIARSSGVNLDITTTTATDLETVSCAKASFAIEPADV